MVKKFCLDLSGHSNWGKQASQDLHSGEKCLLHFSWHPNWPAHTSQTLYSGENCFQCVSWQTCMHEHHRISIVVKVPCLFLTLQVACTSFTGPKYPWKMISTSFLALQIHGSLLTLKLRFAGHPQLWKMLAARASQELHSCELLSTSFLTHKLACTNLAGLPQ